jgi:dephospho-CoA kinase
VSARPQIVEYDPTWPEQFAVVAARVRAAPKHVTLAIGHIGSTAVPVFPAKDIIDVMAVVGTDSDLGSAADALPASGWSCARPG